MRVEAKDMNRNENAHAPDVNALSTTIPNTRARQTAERENKTQPRMVKEQPQQLLSTWTEWLRWKVHIFVSRKKITMKYLPLCSKEEPKKMLPQRSGRMAEKVVCWKRKIERQKIPEKSHMRACSNKPLLNIDSLVCSVWVFFLLVRMPSHCVLFKALIPFRLSFKSSILQQFWHVYGGRRVAEKRHI